MIARCDAELECDYCGLPVAVTAGMEGPLFCCYGCRFAAQITAERGEQGWTRGMMARLGLSIFFSMNVMVFTLALWTQDVYYEPGADVGVQASVLHDLMRYGCLLFAAPVLILLGVPMLENVVATCRRGEITVDVLLLLGVVTSFGYSLVSVIRGEGHVYFEVSCMVLVAVTLGRWLEATGRLKATEAVRSLEKLLPTHARLVTSDNEIPIELAEVDVDQLLRVLPGERIPVDGSVERGTAMVDQQVVTGESEPRLIEVGEPVIGGTLDLDGELYLRVSARPSDGTLQRLVDAVCQAVGRQGRHQRLADRLAAWFTPCVALIALFTVAIHSGRGDWQLGLMAGMAVVLIACPCSLTVATPLAIWAAIGRASREQIVFRNADALSRLASVNTFFFDKTGTLTEGELQVDRLVVADEATRDETLQHAASLAMASTHRASRAVVEFARQQNAVAKHHSNSGQQASTQQLPGRGMVRRVKQSGNVTLLGNYRLMQEYEFVLDERLEQAVNDAKARGQSLCLYGCDGKVRGVFLVDERMRRRTESTLRRLRECGFDVSVLTGDTNSRAARTLASLGIHVEADLLPEDKLAAIESKRSRERTVVMVGDGINDAPALAAADVGIAMGCGTDVSRATADVCLLGDDLSRIPWAIDLSRRTVATIRQNLFWAFAYNFAGIAVAAVGWLNPIIAAVAMAGSSLFVVSNSLRLTHGEGTDTPATDAARHSIEQTPQIPIGLSQGPPAEPAAKY